MDEAALKKALQDAINAKTINEDASDTFITLPDDAALKTAAYSGTGGSFSYAGNTRDTRQIVDFANLGDRELDVKPGSSKNFNGTSAFPSM